MHIQCLYITIFKIIYLKKNSIIIITKSYYLYKKIEIKINTKAIFIIIYYNDLFRHVNNLKLQF